MRKVIYGTETGSIEEYDQCIILLVPDDIDGDALEEMLEDTDAMAELEVQTVVAWEDVIESIRLAAQAEGVDPEAVHRLLLAVEDAIDNND